MGDLLELALLSSEFYPMPQAPGLSCLKEPLAAGDKVFSSQHKKRDRRRIFTSLGKRKSLKKTKPSMG
jgi:hypothetical protein